MAVVDRVEQAVMDWAAELGLEPNQFGPPRWISGHINGPVERQGREHFAPIVAYVVTETNNSGDISHSSSRSSPRPRSIPQTSARR